MKDFFRLNQRAHALFALIVMAVAIWLAMSLTLNILTGTISAISELLAERAQYTDIATHHAEMQQRLSDGSARDMQLGISPSIVRADETLEDQTSALSSIAQNAGMTVVDRTNRPPEPLDQSLSTHRSSIILEGDASACTNTAEALGKLDARTTSVNLAMLGQSDTCRLSISLVTYSRHMETGALE